jgi:hypothetical protein
MKAIPFLMFGALMVFAVLVISWSLRHYQAFLRSWVAYALQRGLVYTPPSGSWLLYRTPRVHGVIDGIAFQFDTYKVGNGKNSTTYTRVRARAIDPIQSSVRVYNEHVFSGLGKLLGFQDVKLDDPAFDEKYVVKADRDADARALLDGSTRSALVRFPRRVSFNYVVGEVDIHWVGLELHHAVLDDACRIVAASCRWRREPEVYR